MSDNAEQDKIKRATFVSGYFKKCIARIRSVAGKTVDVPKYPEKLFGCSPEDLAKWLEVMFPNHTTEDRVMAWRFYGNWHVDHITPMCEFEDLTNIDEQCRCFNFNNLQPLWAMDNITKKRKTSSPNHPANLPCQKMDKMTRLCIGYGGSQTCTRMIESGHKRCFPCKIMIRKFNNWVRYPKNKGKTIDDYVTTLYPRGTPGCNVFAGPLTCNASAGSGIVQQANLIINTSLFMYHRASCLPTKNPDSSGSLSE